jgi:hypothetical protein
MKISRAFDYQQVREREIDREREREKRERDKERERKRKRNEDNKKYARENLTPPFSLSLSFSLSIP